MNIIRTKSLFLLLKTSALTIFVKVIDGRGGYSSFPRAPSSVNPTLPLRSLPLWSSCRWWEMSLLRSAVAPEYWPLNSRACRATCVVDMRQGFQRAWLQYLCDHVNNYLILAVQIVHFLPVAGKTNPFFGLQVEKKLYAVREKHFIVKYLIQQMMFILKFNELLCKYKF